MNPALEAIALGVAAWLILEAGVWVMDHLAVWDAKRRNRKVTR